MKKIVFKNFDAFECACIQNDGFLDFGQEIHSSRTGLSGTCQFVVTSDDESIPAYREDSLPSKLPYEFVIFSNHGSNPENPVRYDKKDWGYLGHSPGVPWANDDEIESPPWWGHHTLTSVRVSANWAYAQSLAWHEWRQASKELPGPTRHGVTIDPSVWGQDRMPFISDGMPDGWVCEQPRRDGSSRLLHRDGRVLEIDDFEKTAQYWADRLESKITPRQILSELAGVADRYGLVVYERDLPELTGSWFKIGCCTVFVEGRQHSHETVMTVDRLEWEYGEENFSVSIGEEFEFPQAGRNYIPEINQELEKFDLQLKENGAYYYVRRCI